MPFDVEQALKDGLTEDQLSDYLSNTRKFNRKAALDAGYTHRQVIDFLAGRNKIAEALMPAPVFKVPPKEPEGIGVLPAVKEATKLAAETFTYPITKGIELARSVIPRETEHEKVEVPEPGPIFPPGLFVPRVTRQVQKLREAKQPQPIPVEPEKPTITPEPTPFAQPGETQITPEAERQEQLALAMEAKEKVPSIGMPTKKPQKRILEPLMQMLGLSKGPMTPIERAKASNLIALSEATGGRVSPAQIEPVYENLMDRIGLKQYPTPMELFPKLGIAASALLSGGGSLGLGAIRTALGITGYMGTKEAESLITQALAGEKPKFLKGREVKEFLGPLKEPFAGIAEAGEIVLPVPLAGKIAWRVKDWFVKQPTTKQGEIVRLIEDKMKHGQTPEDIAKQWKDPDVIEAEWRDVISKPPTGKGPVTPTEKPIIPGPQGPQPEPEPIGSTIPLGIKPVPETKPPIIQEPPTPIEAPAPIIPPGVSTSPLTAEPTKIVPPQIMPPTIAPMAEVSATPEPMPQPIPPMMGQPSQVTEMPPVVEPQPTPPGMGMEPIPTVPSSEEIETLARVKTLKENTDRLIQEGNYQVAKKQPRNEKGETKLLKLGYKPMIWDPETNQLIEHSSGTWVKAPEPMVAETTIPPTAQHLEEMPEEYPEIDKAAMMQDGKVYTDHTHPDIVVENNLDPEKAMRGYTTKQGEFLSAEEVEGKAIEPKTPGDVTLETVPTGYIPAEQWWDKTPMDLQDAFDEVNIYYENMKAKVKPEMDKLQKEYNSIRGKGAKALKEVVRNKLIALEDTYAGIIPNAEGGWINEQMKHHDEAEIEARKAGISDDDLGSFLTDYDMAISTERPYYETNYNKPIRQIFNELVEDYKTDEAQRKTEALDKEESALIAKGEKEKLSPEEVKRLGELRVEKITAAKQAGIEFKDVTRSDLEAMKEKPLTEPLPEEKVSKEAMPVPKDNEVIPYTERNQEEKEIINEYDKKMDSEEWQKAYDEEPEMHFTKEEGHSPLVDELLKDLAREGEKKGVQILDIGSGIGRDSIYLARKGHILQGIDVSDKAVQMANERAKNLNAKFEVGDAENLYQFEENSQDAVISIAALHSTPIKFTFKEIFRVLKPGGQAKLFLYTKTKTGSKWISYWTPGEIKQYATENGFKIEKFREGKNTEPIRIPGLEGQIEQETHHVVTTLRKPEVPEKPLTHTIPPSEAKVESKKPIKDLKALGYDDKQIDRMKPEVASEIVDTQTPANEVSITQDGDIVKITKGKEDWSTFTPNKFGYQSRDLPGLKEGYFIAQQSPDRFDIIESKVGSTRAIVTEKDGKWQFQFGVPTIERDFRQFKPIFKLYDTPQEALLEFNRYKDVIDRPEAVRVEKYKEFGKPTTHRNAVINAVNRGESPEGLRDYPDLAKSSESAILEPVTGEKGKGTPTGTTPLKPEGGKTNKLEPLIQEAKNNGFDVEVISNKDKKFKQMMESMEGGTKAEEGKRLIGPATGMQDIIFDPQRNKIYLVKENIRPNINFTQIIRHEKGHKAFHELSDSKINEYVKIAEKDKYVYVDTGGIAMGPESLPEMFAGEYAYVLEDPDISEMEKDSPEKAKFFRSILPDLPNQEFPTVETPKPEGGEIVSQLKTKEFIGDKGNKYVGTDASDSLSLLTDKEFKDITGFSKDDFFRQSGSIYFIPAQESIANTIHHMSGEIVLADSFKNNPSELRNTLTHELTHWGQIQRGEPPKAYYVDPVQSIRNFMEYVSDPAEVKARFNVEGRSTEEYNDFMEKLNWAKSEEAGKLQPFEVGETRVENQKRWKMPLSYLNKEIEIAKGKRDKDYLGWKNDKQLKDNIAELEGVLKPIRTGKELVGKENIENKLANIEERIPKSDEDVSNLNLLYGDIKRKWNMRRLGASDRRLRDDEIEYLETPVIRMEVLGKVNPKTGKRGNINPIIIESVLREKTGIKAMAVGPNEINIDLTESNLKTLAKIKKVINKSLPKPSAPAGEAGEVSTGDWSKGQSRPFAFDPNSTTNEGRFRLYPPEEIKADTYKSVKALKSREIQSTEGIRFLLAKTNGGKTVIQAIRFDKSIIPEDKAVQWWEENKGKFEFFIPKKETVQVKEEVEPTQPESTKSLPETKTGVLEQSPEGAIFGKRVAEKLKASAGSLTKQIQEKRNPAVAQQNVTARRARQTSSAYEEADRLENLQNKLNALADAHETETVPESLRGITTKTQVESILRHSKFPTAYLHNEWIKDILRVTEHLSNTKEDRQILSRVMGRKDYGGDLYGNKEIQAADHLIKLAGEHGESSARWAKDSLAEYKRLFSVGIDTEEKFIQAKNDLKELGKKPIDRSKEQKIRTAEQNLLGRKIPGYFPTPKATAEKLVEMADIEPGMSVLEPSAGKGNIADVIIEKVPDVDLKTIEWQGELSDILRLKGHEVIGSNFLEHQGKYDRIVMNPPFEKFQDIDHVRHAYDQLNPGGRLVSIMSESPFFRSDKKAVEFREWLDEVGGTSEKLPEGSFNQKSERPTGVTSRVVVIDKPLEDKGKGGNILYSRASKGKGEINESEIQVIGSTKEAKRLQADLEISWGETLPKGAIIEVNVPKNGPSLRSIGRAFSKKVVFIDAKEGVNLPFGGVTILEEPGIIYINVKSDAPHLHSLGHELTHTLKVEEPELYKKLRDRTDDLIQNFDAYQAYLDARSAANNVPTETGEAAKEEFYGDFVGEQFLNRDFWKKLHDREPNLFKKIVKIAKELVDHAVEWLKGQVSIQNTFFKDFRKAQDILANIMKEYAIKSQGKNKKIISTVVAPLFLPFLMGKEEEKRKGHPTSPSPLPPGLGR